MEAIPTNWSPIKRGDGVGSSGLLAPSIHCTAMPPYLGRSGSWKPADKKEADVVEHLEVFRHVGLLTNEPPGTGRVAFYLVVRRI